MRHLITIIVTAALLNVVPWPKSNQYTFVESFIPNHALFPLARIRHQQQQKERHTCGVMSPCTTMMKSSQTHLKSTMTLKMRLSTKNAKRNKKWPKSSLPSSAAAASAVSIPSSVLPLLSSLFQWGGRIPLWKAMGWNIFLFGLIQPKLKQMLTPTGMIHAIVLGSLLWCTLGWRGWSVCVLYLFLGQAVTKVKFEEKKKKGIAESRDGRRGPENLWGSAATALFCACCSVQSNGLSFYGLPSNLYRLGYVAALSTKLADTFASEIGKAYGKTTFLITTFERVEPGTEGAISLEGTLAALLGGSLLPLISCGLFELIRWKDVILATIAAFLATNAESLLGATIQGKRGFKWMTNEVVNFVNTIIGAGLAISAGIMLQ